MAHARLGPSSASRWLDCPASIRLCELAPDRGGNNASVAGSMMHEVFERLMLGGDHFYPEELEALDLLDWGEAHARKIVDSSVTAAKRALSQYGITEFVTETRVNPGARFGREDLWGTGDLIGACSKQKILMVGDLKTGRGRVDPEFNDQLLTYSVGALELIDFVPEIVVMAIFQPTIYGVNPALWETDMNVLSQFESFLKERAEATDIPDLPPSPSPSACKWCPAKSICPAHL
jgi:hypothetical protein